MRRGWKALRIGTKVPALSAALAEKSGVSEVVNENTLADSIVSWMKNSERLARTKQQAVDLIIANQGASDRYVEAMERVLVG